MPIYMFKNMKWTGTVADNRQIVMWGENNGAMFTLSPDDEKNQTLVAAGNYLFPPGITSLVNPYWTYLLPLDNGTSCFNVTRVAQMTGMNADNLVRKYHNRG
jgi:hypothetical protein